MSLLVKLPDNSHRSKSYVVEDAESTSLAKAFASQLKENESLTGVHLLSRGVDAFVARALLARRAERSIDVQYYMFHQDTVGRLLIKELLAAADRGVRVRLLIDDMYGSEADDVWLGLHSHPNIQVRLFNPFVRGHSKNMQFVTRLKSVNHRMHSKTFTVDNQSSIVGGRNIGDEYFEADPDLAFSDLDVLTIGPAVAKVSSEFDQYWNNEHAFPMSTLWPNKKGTSIDQLRSDLEQFYSESATTKYIQALNDSPLANALLNNTAKFSFAKAIVIHDSPEKMDKSKSSTDDLLISQLTPYIEKATQQFILVSPYFVPGRKAAKVLCEMSKRGVQVHILTNSLTSNDVAAVHTGYMRHRKQLLRAGVNLYELNEQLKEEEVKVFTWLPGLSKSSLHAKTMAFDNEAMFVGSFNFDQRSLFINNEIGVLFYEPTLARESSENFLKNIQKVAFKVELIKKDSGNESLRWTGISNGKEVVFDDEPYASSAQKMFCNFMRIIPADFML